MSDLLLVRIVPFLRSVTVALHSRSPLMSVVSYVFLGTLIYFVVRAILSPCSSFVIYLSLSICVFLKCDVRYYVLLS